MLRVGQWKEAEILTLVRTPLPAPAPYHWSLPPLFREPMAARSGGIRLTFTPAPRIQGRRSLGVQGQTGFCSELQTNQGLIVRLC